MDYSPPSTVEVKMNGTVPLLPPICLHGVGRENLAFVSPPLFFLCKVSVFALEVLCHIFQQTSNINLLNRKPWSCNLYPGSKVCKALCGGTTIAKQFIISKLTRKTLQHCFNDPFPVLRCPDYRGRCKDFNSE